MRLVSEIGSILIVTACFCATAQTAFAQSKKEKETAADICSIFGCVEANCLGWQKGDVLIRKRVIFDTSLIDAEGKTKGRLVRSQRLTRLVFDYDRKRFLHVSLEIGESNNFEEDRLLNFSAISGWVSEGPEPKMLVGRINPDRDPSRWRREQFPENQDTFLGMIEFPDYRGVWLNRHPMQHGVGVTSDIFKSGKYFRSSKTSSDSLTVDFNVDEVPPEKDAIPTHRVKFDLDSQMPVHFRKFTTRSNNSIVEGPEYEIKWMKKNEIFLPVSCVASRYRGVPGKETTEHGRENEEFEFHWYSINEDLDEKQFSIKLLKDKKALRKLVDPKLAGAKSLVD